MTDKSTAIGKSFIARADSAAFFEAWVSTQLSRMGLYTLHHPFTLASETGNPVSWYAQTWDLEVSTGFGSGCHMVKTEVKSPSLSFTTPEDYPHQGLLVCSAKSWNNKWKDAKETQRDFLFCSRQTGVVLWLPCWTPIVLTEAHDRTRDERYDCIASHRQYLRPLKDFADYVLGMQPVPELNDTHTVQ